MRRCPGRSRDRRKTSDYRAGARATAVRPVGRPGPAARSSRCGSRWRSSSTASRRSTGRSRRSSSRAGLPRRDRRPSPADSSRLPRAPSGRRPQCPALSADHSRRRGRAASLARDLAAGRGFGDAHLRFTATALAGPSRRPGAFREWPPQALSGAARARARPTCSAATCPSCRPAPGPTPARTTAPSSRARPPRSSGCSAWFRCGRRRAAAGQPSPSWQSPPHLPASGSPSAATIFRTSCSAAFHSLVVFAALATLVGGSSTSGAQAVRRAACGASPSC